MKKLLLVLPFVANVAFAAPAPDEVGICYLFKNNKLASQNTCIISSGSGAGGYYTSLKINNKRYNIEETAAYPDEGIEQKATINNAPAIAYNRDNGFYNKITVNQSTPDKSFLFCYKSKSVDICHN